ncbi:HPP family protein [Nitratidesulfovibrio liaohensis]|uniref:HPP family protein n=1 Tax=Nitratidesulfovibrio liaohensis TaxID=2604158 RepID=A0ABY9R3W0_9BACT|nr:HPP family protein [Nitratidesulfovibrio liaohensis]WMW65688.1 HPP family protein [Nitratidesulfovibrio liaohensis]
MVQLRLNSPCKREFERDVYRPGVISLTRLTWGSLGGGVALAAIALVSTGSGVAVLYPPLAATCFINAACVYLRVARPRPVIAGHLVSSLAGLLAMSANGALHGVLPHWAAQAGALGLAVALAALFMQLADADHPPAAATAAIPVLLPLPMPPLLLPLHMAWGAVVAVLAAMAWNGVWFAYPAPEGENCPKCLGLHQDRVEGGAFLACVLGAALMALRPLGNAVYEAGLGVLGLGGLLLVLHPVLTALSNARAGARTSGQTSAEQR